MILSKFPGSLFYVCERLLLQIFEKVKSTYFKENLKSFHFHDVYEKSKYYTEFYFETTKKYSKKNSKMGSPFPFVERIKAFVLYLCKYYSLHFEAIYVYSAISSFQVLFLSSRYLMIIFKCQ